MGFIKGLLWGVDKRGFLGVVAEDEGDGIDPKLGSFFTIIGSKTQYLAPIDELRGGFDSNLGI